LDNETQTNNIYFVPSGHDAEFRCVVDGEPTPKLEWSKGKWMKLTHGGHNKLSYDATTKQHILIISDIKSKDAGTYTVTATNEHGSVQAPATLMVTDKEEEVADWKAALKHRLIIMY
jgi:obscurin-RhoGEF protein